MRVRNRVMPPIAPGNQQQKGSGKAGANGSSQSTTLEKLRRFQAAAKSKRTGKFKRGSAVAGDEEEMNDFDTALVGAYERLQVDADAEGQGGQQQGEQQQGEQDNALPDSQSGSQKPAKQELPKFLPARARRI